MSTRVRVLAVDAEPAGAALLEGLLRPSFEVLVARTSSEAIAILEAHSDVAVIVASDLEGEVDALALLTICAERFPDTRRVVMTTSDCPHFLRKAINNSQVQHLATRPVNPELLHPAVEKLAGDFLHARSERRLARSSQGATGDRDGSLANKDRLTGLYNHRSFQERFREEISRAQRYAQDISILYVDIDNFGALNRSAGFRCGDEILQKFATILQADHEAVRSSDLASRFGGQEFVVMLPETDKAGATIKAERLRNSISSAILPGGCSVTVSIGVATFPEDATTAGELLEEAVQALRRAKELGRDRVFACGQDEDQRRDLDIPNVHTTLFPTFHDRMGDLVYGLERDRRMSCLYVDLSRLRRIEREFGIAQHNQLLARAGQMLGEMRGAGLRREDLLCRTDDADGYLCFLSPPRTKEGAPLDLQLLVNRITEALDEGLTEAMRGLTRDRPQIAVGMGRVLSNPMIRGERLIHRLVDETKSAASLEWQRQSKIQKVELQELIIQGQLRTAFQPLVDLDTGDAFAFEALTRGPSNSTLNSPAALFSVADAVDLTLELDRACFGTALQNAKGCQPVHRLFLNLLPASFYDAHFIEVQVVDLLDKAGLTPANLVFEITEKLAIENFSAFRQALTRYTDMGFGVAVDDVGTRHSNLEAVMALQPHFIKLSEILCRGVTTSTVKREMVRSLVRIAGAVDAVTVAEGIEDLEDLMTLRDLGVRFGQGYFLARPDFCFPRVLEEAAMAIQARPQRSRATGSVELQAEIVDEPSDEAATGPITNPRTGPGTSPSTSPSTRPSASLSTSPGANPGANPGASPSTNPGASPSRTHGRSASQLDEAFEDEPTRTRGDVNGAV